MAKTKKNKKLSTLLVVTLLALVAVGGMLAYLQYETPTDNNVMTMGNVEIKQHEEFTQDSPLYPAIGELAATGLWDNENVVEKKVTVENTGKSPAYIRTWFAFEGGKTAFDKVMKNTNTDKWTWKEIGETEINDVQYYLVYATYNDILPAEGDDVTEPSLYQVALDYTATNEDVDAIDVNNDGKYNILVLSQAVQAAGFETAVDALDIAFYEGSTTQHPWVNNNPFGPRAKVTNLGSIDVSANSWIGQPEAPLHLDCAFKFEPTEKLEDVEGVSPYRWYHADFEVSSNKIIPANSVTLAGYYNAWCQYNNDNWIALSSADPIDTTGNNEPIRLVKSLGGGGINVSYRDICEYGNDGIGFQCGIAADENVLDPETVITVKLCLYEVENADSESGSHNVEVEGGERIVIGTYTYKVN